MKKYIKILAIVLCFACVLLTGCKKDETKKVEPNQVVGKIKYYVPSDYVSRGDLRGLLYTDETRKVFAKGDTSDYSTFEYIDMIKNSSKGQTLDDYINDVNTKNLKDGDVKFNKVSHPDLEIYGREGYVTKQGEIDIVNYAYMIYCDDFFYGLTISGPNTKKDELSSLAKSIIDTLQKEV